jgi:Ca2+:H+ antiporter
MPDPSLSAQPGAHDTELHPLPDPRAHGSTTDHAHVFARNDALLSNLTITTSAPGASSNRHNVAPDASVKSAHHPSNVMGISSPNEKAAASSVDGAAAGSTPNNSTTTTTTIAGGTDDGGFVGPDKTEEEHDGSAKHTPKGFFHAFGVALWAIITSSWVNVLLVFVPVGIAVAQIESLKGPVAFSMNAIAIIPLAGLLSYATESVAAQMGDAIGALMNVTFGNAVELIIFIIALTKDEIRIVQASLLGSILSNLLLILGMCFLFGGLRYREQIYNSTVTQMSACLLSLSVCSLVIPTAFHASFKNEAKADEDTLKVSRGTSVVCTFPAR